MSVFHASIWPHYETHLNQLFLHASAQEGTHKKFLFCLLISDPKSDRDRDRPSQKSALCVLNAVIELAESFASALNPSEVNRPKALMACAAFCHRRLMRKLFSLSVLISLKLWPDFGVNSSQTCSRHWAAVMRLF